MLNAEKVAEQVLKHNSDIAALWESAKSAHKRIDDNDRIIEGIHKLAANVESLAVQVEMLTKKLETQVTRLDTGLRLQGERIGNIEQAIILFGNNTKLIEEITKRVDAIEKEPVHKWNKFTWLIFMGVVSAVIAVIMARLL